MVCASCSKTAIGQSLLLECRSRTVLRLEHEDEAEVRIAKSLLVDRWLTHAFAGRYMRASALCGVYGQDWYISATLCLRAMADKGLQASEDQAAQIVDNLWKFEGMFGYRSILITAYPIDSRGWPATWYLTLLNSLSFSLRKRSIRY